jgi:hypothetical protein
MKVLAIAAFGFLVIGFQTAQAGENVKSCAVATLACMANACPSGISRWARITSRRQLINFTPPS